MASRRSTSGLPAKEKNAFWSTVQKCLVTFHGQDRTSARSQALGLRKRIEHPPEGIDGEMIYHNEPFYVACELAGVRDIGRQEALLKHHMGEYQKMFGEASE